MAPQPAAGVGGGPQIASGERRERSLTRSFATVRENTSASCCTPGSMLPTAWAGAARPRGLELAAVAERE